MHPLALLLVCMWLLYHERNFEELSFEDGWDLITLSSDLLMHTCITFLQIITVIIIIIFIDIIIIIVIIIIITIVIICWIKDYEKGSTNPLFGSSTCT